MKYDYEFSKPFNPDTLSAAGATASVVPPPSAESQPRACGKANPSISTKAKLVDVRGVPDLGTHPLAAHSDPVMKGRDVVHGSGTAGICTDPVVISPGVFVGEGKAQSGEKVFVRMEKITDANKPRWEAYCRSSAVMTLESRSPLSYAIRFTKKITDAEGNVRFVNEKYDELAPVLGQTQEEFDDFIGSLGKNGFTGAREDRTRRMSIHNIRDGALHLHLSTEGEQYVIYATKTADFHMPDPREGGVSDILSFSKYKKLYGDLLICVGADFTRPDVVFSKGMFRNPVSALEKTHKGLSMVIRGFTGAVAEKYFPDKTTLLCKPLASMQCAISSALQPDDYMVTGLTQAEAVSFAEEAIRDGDSPEMPWNHIKISALDRIYRSHAST